MNAMRKDPSDSTKINALLKSVLMDKVHDLEVFMKEVDYSYYYEQDDTTTDDKVWLNRRKRYEIKASLLPLYLSDGSYKSKHRFRARF